jgi:membrane-associated protease RseP (regulator of RpoE activity)
MSPFYTSSLGPSLSPLANLLYWIFFLNFNLAIFNALPIYPLDGGQAFLVGVKALGRGKLSEARVMQITAVATFAVLALILGVLAGPYIL